MVCLRNMKISGKTYAKLPRLLFVIIYNIYVNDIQFTDIFNTCTTIIQNLEN